MIGPHVQFLNCTIVGLSHSYVCMYLHIYLTLNARRLIINHLIELMTRAEETKMSIISVNVIITVLCCIYYCNGIC